MTARRKKLLVFGYRPPPYFGPSTAYQTLLRSKFGTHFDIRFIDLTVARDLSDVERFRPGKLVKLLGFFFTELGLLLRHRFDACLYPVSLNRMSFLKDALLLWLARVFGVPTVLWAHGNNLPDFRARSPRWLQRLIDWTTSRAAAAVVLGECLRFNFEPHLPAERIFVAPLGIEPSPPLPGGRPAATAPTVLFLSNLVREKGVLILLQAIPAVLKRRPGVRFIFAGSWCAEPDRLEAERLIHEHGLTANIEFAGVVSGEKKARLLSVADVLALPTFYSYEAHPNVLLEALQAGLPVVTTPRGAIPEIIADGVNGLLVREQDAGDLAEKILRLLDDPALRERMARANRERFATSYTSEHYGRRMIAVFEALPPC